MIRYREKVSELEGSSKQAAVKQEKAIEKNRAVKQHMRKAIQVKEEQDSKTTLFRALLQKRERLIEEGGSISSKRRKMYEDHEDEKLLRDLSALHAQSCLLMLPRIIEEKASTLEKNTSYVLNNIDTLKQYVESMTQDPNSESPMQKFDDFSVDSKAAIASQELPGTPSMGDHFRSVLSRASNNPSHPAVAFNDHADNRMIRM